ncbi:MAG: rod shape-determining protein MreD [Pseudomonadota bacterium]
MSYNYDISGRIIIISFIIALMITVMPWSSWLIWLRPDFTLLVLLYWVMTRPYLIGIRTAFVLGIFVDLLDGTVLGLHAFAYVVLTYIVIKYHRKFNAISSLQNIVLTAAILLLYSIIILAIQSFTGNSPATFLYWLSFVGNVIFWLLIYWVLTKICRRYHVN